MIVLPYNDLDWCERVLRENASELACLIMEPVMSSFGYLPGDVEFLKGLRELTTELGIILIYDEVQSFRIAPGGAQEAFGVIPDMTSFGKIIGGGTPVGAFGGRADIMELFDPTKGAPIAHAGTFNANPVTMAAGEVVMNHLTPDVYDRMNALGGELRAKLSAVFDEFEVPAQVTGVGSLFGIHFTSEEITDYRTVVPWRPGHAAGAVRRPAQRRHTAPVRHGRRHELPDRRIRHRHARGRHTPSNPASEIGEGFLSSFEGSTYAARSAEARRVG